MPLFAENLKRSLWIAPGTVTNGVRQFGEPVEYRWNWRALSTSADMMAFGAEYLDYRKANTTTGQIVGLNPFDAAWLDRVPNGTFDALATDADFYVLGIVKGAGGIAEVFFKRLSHDG